jgi:hypothetical protein
MWRAPVTDVAQSGRAGAAGLGLVALLLVGCTSDVTTLGLGERTDRFKLTIKVTNVGTGFGRADVVFSAGPAQDACTEVLGPGESCSTFVRAQVRPETAEITVAAEPGSQFVGWTGAHCTGTSGECTVQNESGDFDTRIAVEPRFDLVGGG